MGRMEMSLAGMKKVVGDARWRGETRRSVWGQAEVDSGIHV